MKEKLESIKPELKKALKENGVKKAGVFGSYATGEANRNSDLDILIEFDGSLLDLVRLENKLKKILKKKVDLLTYGSINPLLKKRILSEEIKII